MEEGVMSISIRADIESGNSMLYFTVNLTKGGEINTNSITIEDMGSEHTLKIYSVADKTNQECDAYNESRDMSADDADIFNFTLRDKDDNNCNFIHGEFKFTRVELIALATDHYAKHADSIKATAKRRKMLTELMSVMEDEIGSHNGRIQFNIKFGDVEYDLKSDTIMFKQYVFEQYVFEQ
jgi:hypothetical protein